MLADLRLLDEAILVLRVGLQGLEVQLWVPNDDELQLLRPQHVPHHVPITQLQHRSNVITASAARRRVCCLESQG